MALTVSPYVKSMAKIIAAHHRRYPNLRYLPQDLTTLGTLLYGDAPGRWRSSDCGPGAGARSARRYGAS